MSDRSLSKNTFLHLSVTLFNLIDKVYTKVTLAKTDCSFHLVTGMLFVAHDDLLSSMHLTYVSHIMGQKNHLQQFKYWNSLSGTTPVVQRF